MFLAVDKVSQYNKERL